MRHRHLSYFRQAFYFQLREIVSNLPPLTAVWVPEDVTIFCTPTGNRTRLLSVKGICPKPIDDRSILVSNMSKNFNVLLLSQQRYKDTTFILICQVTNKKKPIFFGDGFLSRLFRQYYPISTLEVSPSVAGVPNIEMVFIEFSCIF